MSIERTRHFLGWNRPALDAAAEWILTEYKQLNNELDLGSIRLVVPGGRAARVLLGNLVDLCAKQNILLIPPVILTPLEIPSAVLGVPGQHASKLTLRLAWIQALQTCDPDMLSELIPDPPESERWDQWIGIAGWIAGVAGELCDAGMRMNSVAEHASMLLDESDSQRWTTLGQIQTRYERIINDLGVIDDRLASMDRVQRDDPADHPESSLIIIGMPQLGSIARGAIDRDQCSVVSLVFAPDSLADRFDDLGCVLTQQWANAHLDIDESRIIFEHDPASMCQRALTQLALQGDPIDTSSCVIGLADETMIGQLERLARLTGSKQGTELHSPSGTTASNTPPGQLVTLIHQHLCGGTFDTLSKLIRHPSFQHALTTKYSESADAQIRPPAWWLKAVDRIRQDHVQTSIVQIPSGTYIEYAKDAQFVLGATNDLLTPLIDQEHIDQPLDHWAQRLAQTLEQIYTGIELDQQSEHDRPNIDGIKAIRKIIDEISQAEQIGQVMPVVSAPEAVSLLLDRLGETRIAETLNRDAIETLGWLELPLDPAPVCVVVGMSEACVPGTITHDPLLPGSLRNALGMMTNEDRLARDTYLMTAINASRDAVFMCARNGDKNDPITPSRLLLKSSGPTLANRVRRFVDPKLDQPSKYKLAIGSKPGDHDQFRKQLRVADDFVTPTTLRVTDFDSYLKSPASWYLERHIGLNELDTDIRELTPILMGNLIHSVLEGFGKDPSMRDLDDAEAINTALTHLLDQESMLQFGKKPPAAVLVQTQLLSYRLEWFAIQQAQRRRDGWSITHTEWSPDTSHPPSIMVDDQLMGLRGKVDRIDIHNDGRIAIIDYKTGKITDARKAHQSKDAWKKLQLPLYRHIVAQLFGDQPLALGYAGLPATQNEPVWSFAKWNDEELQSADEAASDVVRDIRKLSPGDKLELGDSPPDAGILGFITGQRFDTGGHEILHDPEPAETEVGS